MKIDVHWDNPEQTVVRWEVSTNWSAEDFHIATQESVALRRSVPHPVAVIIDFTKGNATPSGILTHLKSGATIGSEGRELIVAVSKHTFHKAIYSMFSKLNPKLSESILMVETVEDAHAAIAEWRAAEE